MYTVCPKCALTLVVTAGDLRVAQGFVRCGRCSNVFNALARLSEDRTGTASGAASMPSQTSPRPPAQSPAPEPQPRQELTESDSIPDTALEFDPEATDVSKVFVEQTPDPQWSAATGQFKELARTGASPAPSGSINAGSAAGPSRSASQHSPRSGKSPSASGPGGAPAQMSSTPQPAPSAAPPQSIPTDEDSQFDIEVDAEFLAATTQLRPQPPPPPSSATKRSTASSGSSASAGASGSVASEAAATQATAAATPSTAATAPATTSMADTTAATADATPPSATASTSGSSDASDRPRTRVPRRRPVAERAAAMPGVGVEPALADDTVPGAPVEARVGEATPSRLAPKHLWSGGTAALVILLLVQIIHHYRHDLATHERLYKPLTALYSALGISLVPRWNLGAYDVRQLGASADNTNTGRITVRASVKNTAKQAQPLPLLRVTLQDRFGNRIAARDVPPQSYLPAAIPAASFLLAGQRIDAEMAFVDPGSNAVGFEIDACLPAPGGSIVCANDAGAH